MSTRLLILLPPKELVQEIEEQAMTWEAGFSEFQILQHMVRFQSGDRRALVQLAATRQKKNLT